MKRYMYPMLVAALFTKAKTWKQPMCLSMGEQIKIWCMHTMDCNLAMKENEILPIETTWMDLEGIMK